MKQLHKPASVFLPMLLALLLLNACKQEQATALAPPAVEVEVVTIRPQPVNLVVELPGRTAAYRIAEVRPQVGGIIKKRLFTEGSEVKAGQLLYQIDPDTYQAKFDSAKATLARAEALEYSARLKAQRYKTLVQTKAVSEQDQVEMDATWKQTVADVAAAKAALDSARINLDYTRVTAPISGRIGKSAVTEGALVTAEQATALATIQQLDPLYVDLNQSSIELLNLRKELSAGQKHNRDTSQPVKVLLEDGSEYGQTGMLEFSDVTVNQTTGTVILRAIVANADHELLPGMFVRARIDKGQVPNGILVPAASVSRDRKGQAMVMLVNDQSIVEARLIQAGQNMGDQILVSEGLADGEQLIVSGLQKIKAGVPVKAVAASTPDRKQSATDATASIAKTE
ncbi:efflux RND transporter periplasmic adaptor subunit [Desulfobulbus elongatus]|uniref:efflux RND transporter periplasmic adaptor subunit n=1 Tax=Desulfobulbus elongatus TaxID=53332 RepID=UPI00048950AF|nr:efflux RND transporter periplasmic adaptor subunit [Desulfobulbus elongatus]